MELLKEPKSQIFKLESWEDFDVEVITTNLQIKKQDFYRKLVKNALKMKKAELKELMAK